MVTFILVHGTFVKSAEWPALQRALVEITNLGQNARIEKIPWTGSNRATARQTAAEDISNKVRAARSNNPDEKIFLIGHSHGGSAIAYFLKGRLEGAEKVDGCAFLSTPFVAIRRRNDVSRILGALTFCPILIATTFLGSLPSTVRHWGLLAVGITALLGGAVFAISRRSTEQIVQQQTADIPDGRYLFLRYSGDEAAAALSSAQFIAWLGAKVSALLAQQLHPLFSSRAGTAFAVGYIVLGMIVAAGGFAALMSEGERIGYVTSPNFGLEPFHRIISEITEAFAGGYTLSSFIFVAMALAAASLIAFTYVSAVAALMVLLLQALTTWAFGWTGFFTGFLVELAIEPLPFGTHSLTHIDWSEGADRLAVC